MNAPISYRPFEDKDYEVLVSWWRGHNSPPWPKVVLPRGLIAVGSGVDMAASFLYLTPDKIAVIEFTTVNPALARSRDSLAAVKGLFAALEEEARAAGCLAVITFVKPNGSEQHIVTKIGYATSTDDCGHRLYAKPLRNQENWHPPEGGVVQCQR